MEEVVCIPDPQSAHEPVGIPGVLDIREPSGMQALVDSQETSKGAEEEEVGIPEPEDS